MTIRRFSFEIEGLFKATGEIDIADSITSPITPVDPPITEPEPDPEPVEPEPIEPPVIEPEPVDPPATDDWINITDTFYSDVASKSVIEFKAGKKYRIDRFIQTPIDRDITFLKVGEGANPIVLVGIKYFKSWLGGQDGSLFFLQSGTARSKSINWCIPPQLRTCQPFTPSFFRTATDGDWRILIEDCDTTILGKNGGFGLGFIYGGKQGNHVGLIDFKHAGSGLMDAKNPYEGHRLILTMENVETDYENPSEFGTAQVKCRGKIQDGIFTITSEDVTTEAFLPSYQMGDNQYNSNETFIIHMGRFVFLWDGKGAILDDKRIKLKPIPSGNVQVLVKGSRVFFPSEVEPHAGMSFNGTNKILTKDRTESSEWVYWPDAKLGSKDTISMLACTVQEPLEQGYQTIYFEPQPITLSEQDCYLIAKQNALFPTDERTAFGKHEVMNADIIGHLCYNHSNIDIWAKNVNLRGYYRQSGRGLGNASFVNLVDCTGFDDQFDPVAPITHDPSLPMPQPISELL